MYILLSTDFFLSLENRLSVPKGFLVTLTSLCMWKWLLFAVLPSATALKH